MTRKTKRSDFLCVRKTRYVQHYIKPYFYRYELTVTKKLTKWFEN